MYIYLYRLIKKYTRWCNFIVLPREIEDHVSTEIVAEKESIAIKSIVDKKAKQERTMDR